MKLMRNQKVKRRETGDLGIVKKKTTIMENTQR